MRNMIAGAAVAAGTVALAAGIAAAPAMAGTAAPAVHSSVSRCTGTAIRVRHSGIEGATGHGSFVLWFRNLSHRTCSLTGYPGLDTLGPRGHVERHAVRTLEGFTGGANAVRTIVLRPNHVASADVEWMNFRNNGGDCLFSSSIAATPANTSKTVHFALHISNCDLQVHPTVAGDTGNVGHH